MNPAHPASLGPSRAVPAAVMDGARTTGLAVAYRAALADPDADPEGVRAAFGELWEAVRRMAWRQARRVYRASPGCEEGDLVQAAAAHLPTIARGYDPSRGVGFLAYFTRSARQVMGREYRDLTHPVRVPEYVRCEVARRLRRNPPPPRPIPAAHMDDARRAMSRARPPQEVLERLPSRAERSFGEEEFAAVSRRLDLLPARDREVIRLRFGLHGGPTRNLREIGEAMRLTKQRIKQIEASSLRILRDDPKPTPTRRASRGRSRPCGSSASPPRIS